MNVEIEGYTVIHYLGKGCKTKCYAVQSHADGLMYACKVIPKSAVQTEILKLRLWAEIRIHRVMDHSSIVKFVRSFKDKDNIYIVTELCKNGSLLGKVKKGGSYYEVGKLDEATAKVYFKQILEACKYMHDRRIMHRDLKLGNIFLDEADQVKVGDFGLAAEFSLHERRRTICGTPNYIAPEMLNSDSKTRGHSYEVDIWSLGIILYTMLVGMPPFETHSVKETYRRIQEKEFYFPKNVNFSIEARSLIARLLLKDPLQRPSLKSILDDPFVAPPILRTIWEYRYPLQFADNISLDPVQVSKLPRIDFDEYTDCKIVTWSIHQLFGLCYKLSNGSYGMHFKDGSGLQRLESGEFLYFDSLKSQCRSYAQGQLPNDLYTKHVILCSKRRSLDDGHWSGEAIKVDNLLEIVIPIDVSADSFPKNTLYIKRYVHIDSTVLFQFHNDTVQVELSCGKRFIVPLVH